MSCLPYYDRDGYYTYEQVIEAFNYVKIKDPTDNKYQKNMLYNHLTAIYNQMKRYDMNIVLARDVLKYDEFTTAIVGVYRLIPISFKFISKVRIDRVVSASNYRNAKFCGNCKNFSDQTDYDDMLNGICDIHTEINMEYDPPLKSPLVLECYGVCDDFIPKEEMK